MLNPTAATEAANSKGCNADTTSLHETPAKLVTVSFQYVANKVVLLISCIASMVAAVQTRGSKQNMNVSLDPALAHPKKTGNSGTSAKAQHEHAPIGQKAHPTADAQEVQHKAKRLRSDSATDFSAAQDLPRTAKSGRLLPEATKPGNKRAIEKIAKAVQPAGPRHSRKKRRLKKDTAAGQLVQSSQAVQEGSSISDLSDSQQQGSQGDHVGHLSAAGQAQAHDANVGSTHDTKLSEQGFHVQ